MRGAENIVDSKCWLRRAQTQGQQKAYGVAVCGQTPEGRQWLNVGVSGWSPAEVTPTSVNIPLCEEDLQVVESVGWVKRHEVYIILVVFFLFCSGPIGGFRSSWIGEE